jgi:hypothetical protein
MHEKSYKKFKSLNDYSQFSIGNFSESQTPINEG